ncbi:protein SOSEKI 1-like isoform X1 [Nicotiana tabacum]|uniref:Protein SOSEKI 1-like isoform X1 n=3 Tax=Nicotiana TaxID=4085 RepID=A0AC58UVC3_TOBAC|nr:PREDICTED: protein UPSTREAM OF FLC isoform X2 [Nicotiana sylvestris]
MVKSCNTLTPQHTLKRLMEAQTQGGAEVRRLHIIYFLSRKGRIEHPHLIRVHHFSRNGIRLRDVKRWLGELRGKDMPESFAWSYKRKYKTGYVWQDLLDEDLITPISDNEYVLKGSEVSKDVSCGEKGVLATMQKDQTNQEDHIQDPFMDSSKKTPSEIEEESQNIASETSTLTTDSPKLQEEEEKDSENKTKPEKVNNFENNSSSFSSSSSSFGSKKTKKKTEDHVKENGEKITTTPSSEKPSKNPSFDKSRSYSNGASSIFRNLITCGAVDTNDSGIIPIRKNRPSFSSSGEKAVSFSSEICKAEKVGGSQRIFGTAWNQQHQHTNGRKSCDGVYSSSKNKNEFGSRRSVSANYKPVNGPNCSQCGKPFKPEKLHTHMKSCKGMKALAKGANSVTSATEKTSKDASKVDSVSGTYLTH